MIEKTTQQMDISKGNEGFGTQPAAQGRYGVDFCGDQLGNELSDYEFFKVLDAKKQQKVPPIPFHEILEEKKTARIVWKRMGLPIFTNAKITGYFLGNESDFKESIRPGSRDDHLHGYIRFEVYHKDLVTKEFRQDFKGKAIYKLLWFLNRYRVREGCQAIPVFFHVKLGRYVIDLGTPSKVSEYGVKVPGKNP